MARILSIDYGKKKTGLAVTDPLQIIATGLDTVATPKLKEYLESYFLREEVEKIVIGYPTHKDGNPTFLTKEIDKLIQSLHKKFTSLQIERVDESFSSVRAREVIRMSGAKKKVRRDKELVDKISAVIILQEYLGHI